MAVTQEELIIKVRTDGTVAVEKLNSALGETDKKAKQAESGLAGLGKAAAGAVAGFIGFQAVKQFLGDSIQASINLEKSMLSLKSVAKATGNDFQKVQADIKKLGADGTLSIGGIAKQYGLLLQQGVKADQAFSFVEAGKKLATFRGITGNAEEDLGSFVKALQTGSQELAENLDPSLNAVIKRLGGMAAISQDAAKKTELLNAVIANGNALTAEYESTLAGAAGAQAQANTAYRELLEVIGGRLAPAFATMAKAAAGAIKFISENVDEIGRLLTYIPGLTQIVGLFQKMFSIFGDSDAEVAAKRYQELADIMARQDRDTMGYNANLAEQKKILGDMPDAFKSIYDAAVEANMPLERRIQLMKDLQDETTELRRMNKEQLQEEIDLSRASARVAFQAAGRYQIQGNRAAATRQQKMGESFEQDALAAEAVLAELNKREIVRINSSIVARKKEEESIKKTAAEFDKLGERLKMIEAIMRSLGEVTNGIIQITRSTRASGVLGGAGSIFGGVGGTLSAVGAYYGAQSAAQKAAGDTVGAAASGTTAAGLATGATTLGIGAAAVGIGAAIFGAIEAADEEEAERIRRRREREEQARERAHQIELNRIKTVTALIKIQMDLEVRLNELEKQRRDYAIQIANLSATSQTKILRNELGGAKATMEQSASALGLTGKRAQQQAQAELILQREAKGAATRAKIQQLVDEFKANPKGGRAAEILREIGSYLTEAGSVRPGQVTSNGLSYDEVRSYFFGLRRLWDVVRASRYESGSESNRMRVEAASVLGSRVETNIATGQVRSQQAQAFLDARMEALGLKGEINTQGFRDALSRIDVQQRTAATTGQAYDATGDLRAVAEGLRQNLGIADLSNITQGELDKIGTTGQAFERYQLLLDVLGKIKDATESTAENTSPELVKARQRSFFDFARSGFVSNSIFQSLGVDGLAIQNPQSVSSLATNIGGAGVGSTSNLVNLTQQILAVQREQRDLLAGIYANTDNDAGTAGGAVLRDNVISIIGDVNARKIV